MTMIPMVLMMDGGDADGGGDNGSDEFSNDK